MSDILRFWVAIAFLPILVLAGCVEPEVESAEVEQAVQEFDREALRDGCELLTAEAVAALVQVAADDLRQISMGQTCVYTWDEGEVRLLTLNVRPDAEAARRSFEQSYSPMTAEEAAAASEALSEQLDRQVADGELSQEDADMAAGLGGMAGNIAATAEIQPVDGLGDAAVYDGTVRTMELPMFGEVKTAESQAAVLLGNLVFTVEANLWTPANVDAMRVGPSEQELNRNREVTLAVASAVLHRLREIGS